MKDIMIKVRNQIQFCFLHMLISTKATLRIISAAGFGLRMPWKEGPQDIPLGHKMSFTEAMNTAMHDIYVKVLTPSSLFKIAAAVPIPIVSRRLNTTTLAYKELGSYMLEIVASARSSLVDGSVEEDAALLRALVRANMDEDSNSRRLTDDELLSNVFVFLLAGHGP